MIIMTSTIATATPVTTAVVRTEEPVEEGEGVEEEEEEKDSEVEVGETTREEEEGEGVEGDNEDIERGEDEGDVRRVLPTIEDEEKEGGNWVLVVNIVWGLLLSEGIPVLDESDGVVLDAVVVDTILTNGVIEWGVDDAIDVGLDDKEALDGDGVLDESTKYCEWEREKYNKQIWIILLT